MLVFFVIKKQGLLCLIWCFLFKVKSAEDLRRLTERVEVFLTNKLFPKVLEGIRVWLDQCRADIKVVDGQERSNETDVSFILVLII